LKRVSKKEPVKMLGFSNSINLATCSGGYNSCNTNGTSMYNVVTSNSTYWTIRSTGCPNYDYTTESTPCSAKNQSYVWYLPRYPQISTTKIYVGLYGANNVTIATSSLLMGNIGIFNNLKPRNGNQRYHFLWKCRCYRW
jgi:hypothetical protein